MVEKEKDAFIIGRDDLILVTGASGLIGPRLLTSLLGMGFRKLRCLVRPTSQLDEITLLSERLRDRGHLEIVTGNLLSPHDCISAVKSVCVIFHLATGRNGKSYPDVFMNAVVTTRNLLEASLRHTSLRRFVNISSLAVYSNTDKAHGRLLDEACPVEKRPELRGDPYCFAKVKQDELVAHYANTFNIPYVTVRPGYVLTPTKQRLSGRVGIDTFGIFLHMGGSNRIPFTYVDNCADAIALAGVRQGVEGEVFNVVDDDLPSSRRFLRLYKQNVAKFRSIYIPHLLSYFFCWSWEKYSKWSKGQLPLSFNRKHWHAYWKSTRYSNVKLKTKVGWTPRLPMREALRRTFVQHGDGEQRA